MSQRDVIVLTGAPGSGKTTTAELLAKSAERTVHIEADWFWSVVKNGKVDPWLREAEQQNKVALEAAAHAAVCYAKGGYRVILEGIIGPWFADILFEVFRREQVASYYIVLRPTLEVSLQRIKQRENGLKEIEVVEQLWVELGDLGKYNGNVIDNSAMSPDETCATALEMIRITKG